MLTWIIIILAMGLLLLFGTDFVVANDLVNPIGIICHLKIKSALILKDLKIKSALKFPLPRGERVRVRVKRG